MKGETKYLCLFNSTYIHNDMNGSIRFQCKKLMQRVKKSKIRNPFSSGIQILNICPSTSCNQWLYRRMVYIHRALILQRAQLFLKPPFSSKILCFDSKEEGRYYMQDSATSHNHIKLSHEILRCRTLLLLLLFLQQWTHDLRG